MIRSAMNIITALGLALCSALAAAQLYEGARLIPGDGGPAIESSAFLVEGGKIMRAGKRGEVAAPAGVARPIVHRLNTEIVAIMRAPDMRERLQRQGAEPQSNTPEEFSAYIKSEIAKWAKIVRDTGIARQ